MASTAHENADVPPALSPNRAGNHRFPTVRVVMALILREMATRYGQSPGGYLWAFMLPLGWIVMLALAFGLVAHSPSLGNSFILFYASGYLPFNLYNSIQPPVMSALNFSRPLMRYPIVTWIDAVIARFLLNSLTGLLVFYILLYAIRLAIGVNTPLDHGAILAALIFSAFIGLGVGVLTCYLTMRLPAFAQVWTIAMRPLFLVSGVLFMYEDLPPMAQNLLIWNPLMHVTSLAREGVYSTYSADFVSYSYMTIWVLVPLFFGLLLLKRHSKELLMKI